MSAVKTDSKTVSAVKMDSIKTNADTPARTKRCGNCNRTGHTSHLAEREASCPSLGKKCDSCGKEGHFKACCKSGKRQSTTNNEVAEGDAMSVGALAGMMMMMADVNMAMARYSGYKVLYISMMGWLVVAGVCPASICLSN